DSHSRACPLSPAPEFSGPSHLPAVRPARPPARRSSILCRSSSAAARLSVAVATSSRWAIANSTPPSKAAAQSLPKPLLGLLRAPLLRGHLQPELALLEAADPAKRPRPRSRRR